MTHKSKPNPAVFILALLMVSCASTPPEPAHTARAPRTRDALLHDFVRAWNAEDHARITQLFAPSRRPLVRARQTFVSRRVRTWELLRWRVEPICHGRGSDYAIITLSQRTRSPLWDDASTGRGLVHDEALWVWRDPEQTWWIYSL